MEIMALSSQINRKSNQEKRKNKILKITFCDLDQTKSYTKGNQNEKREEKENERESALQSQG